MFQKESTDNNYKTSSQAMRPPEGVVRTEWRLVVFSELSFSDPSKIKLIWNGPIFDAVVFWKKLTKIRFFIFFFIIHGLF